MFFAVLGLIYLCVLGTGTWYLLGTERRQAWLGWTYGALARIAGNAERIRRRVGANTSRYQGRSTTLCRRIVAGLWRHRLASLTTLVLLLGPALLIQLLAPAKLDNNDQPTPTTDPVVLSLLRGEQLVPPPQLPPEVFVTEELRSQRLELASASREWRMLDADFRQCLLTVYHLMQQQGYQMALLEGYRSPQRQDMLARLGAHVTGARAFQSYHQYGLAADSAFLKDGKVLQSEKDPWVMEGYRLFGTYAEAVGLVWGGRWKILDFGHVELQKQRTSTSH
jgi:peptidoglycan L-alanyl-D-glutamate endopeptidase CwlK